MTAPVYRLQGIDVGLLFADFSEPVVYLPRDGERYEFNAVVLREEPAIRQDVGDDVLTQTLQALLPIDRSPTPSQYGDQMVLPVRHGGVARRLRVVSVLERTNGYWRVGLAV